MPDGRTAARQTDREQAAQALRAGQAGNQQLSAPYAAVIAKAGAVKGQAENLGVSRLPDTQVLGKDGGDMGVMVLYFQWGADKCPRVRLAGRCCGML